MSGYLCYSYSICLSQDEENEINERVSQSQEQFCKGFNKGLKVSLMIYSIYSLTTTVVHANEQCPSVDPTPNKSPSSAPRKNGKELVKSKPGFKPVSAGAKGVAIGGAGGVCTAALQSGDFVLGLMCAVLLIGIGVINNRE